MFCEKCGTRNAENAAFCRKCGAKLSANRAAPATSTAKSSRNPARVPQRSPKRRRLLHTTRKTQMGYLVPNLVTDILLYGVIAGIGFSKGAELYASFWYRSEGESLQRAAGLFLLIGMLSAIYHVMVSKTYVDFFEDRIVGAGMQGIQSKTFALRYEQILDISSSRGFLNLESGSGVFLVINTPAGSYKIITNKAKEKEILEFYDSLKEQTDGRTHVRPGRGSN